MSKFILFYLLWRITGNPILAVIVILVIYYIIDRRYVGLLPSVIKPFRRRMRMSELRRLLSLNPHDKPAQYELAQAYIEVRQYRQALRLLEALPATMRESADVLYDTGACQLAVGKTAEGESLIVRALEQDAGLRHGEPYLRLATALAPTDPTRALALLNKFHTHNVSSCESYYRMGRLYKQLGDPRAAQTALRECVDTYRVLPKFRRRAERRWAVLARLQLWFSR